MKIIFKRFTIREQCKTLEFMFVGTATCWQKARAQLNRVSLNRPWVLLIARSTGDLETLCSIVHVLFVNRSWFQRTWTRTFCHCSRMVNLFKMIHIIPFSVYYYNGNMYLDTRKIKGNQINRNLWETLKENLANFRAWGLNNGHAF